MRINPLTETINAEFRKTDALKKSAEKVPAKLKSTDKTEFSAESSQRLGDAKAQSAVVSAQLSAIPDVRQEKIAEVKNKIERGYYNSEEFTDKLASKLLKEFGFKE